MENLMTLRLEAINPGRNHFRQYVFQLGQDLIGFWTLDICYGRIGQRGTATRFASKDPLEIRKIISDRMKQRMSAERRIATKYQVREFSTISTMNPQDWLPRSLAIGDLI